MNQNDTIIVFSSSNAGLKSQDLDWKDKIGAVAVENVVDVSSLQNNVNTFFVNIGKALEGTRNVESQGFRLSEIEFTLEIGAEGKVGLLGSGAKASGKGGIKFVLKKGE